MVAFFRRSNRDSLPSPPPQLGNVSARGRFYCPRWGLQRTQVQMESGLLPKVSPEEAQANFRLAIESGNIISRRYCGILELLAVMAYCCRGTGMAYCCTATERYGMLL